MRKIFYTFVLMCSYEAVARVPAPSVEESSSEKRAARLSQEQYNRTKAPTKRYSAGAARQGQATSSAYANNAFTVSVGGAVPKRQDKKAVAGGKTGSGGDNRQGQPKYSTATGLGVQAISTNALNRAKAQHNLKKKLQAESYKAFQLQDVSGEKAPKDPRDEIIYELMKASQDIAR